MLHLLLDIHVEHQMHHTSELEVGCTETLLDVAYEVEKLGGEIYDYYLDYENCKVVIDVAPESIYSVLVLTDNWLKAYIRN